MIEIRKPEWATEMEIPLTECTVSACSDTEGGYCVICHAWHTAVAFGTLRECQDFIGEHECQFDMGVCIVCGCEKAGVSNPKLEGKSDEYTRGWLATLELLSGKAIGLEEYKDEDAYWKEKNPTPDFNLGAADAFKDQLERMGVSV